MLEFADYTKFLIAILAIINPGGAVPIIMAMTGGASKSERKRISNIVVLSVAIILWVSLFFGQGILAFFGISIDSFRIAGGILVMLMALSMLQAKVSGAVQTQEEASEGESKESVAVVPLAMPLLAGPGAISTVILFSDKGSGVTHYALTSAIIFTLAVILWIVFQFIPWITKHVSQTGLNIFSRIMGLILASIAIEFLANGIKGLFPALA